MDMNVSLLIRLIDQVSAPARQMRDNLRGTLGDLRAGFGDAIRQGFSVSNVENSIRQAETRLGEARGRMLGAIGTGLALAAPVLNMGQFESQLVGFGNTAGIFGDDLKDIEAQLRATAPLVNKSASELLTGLEYLVGKGLSPEEGLAAIRSVGMTATATGASIQDMSASGFAALDNLKVPADQLQLAFDAMAQAGKSGGFELRDMAQHFPMLSASAQSLKMEGVAAIAELGAALQIASKGSGGPAEAANNLQNFLSKLSSQETVKRFADLGIDVEAEFQKAADNGVSVFEHMLGVINEVTDGNQFKMGELFGDQQVLNFLRPMMENLEEFRAIRDAALGADGVNAGDFTRVMETFAEQVKAASVQIDNLASNSGVLLGIAKDLIAQFTAGVSAANAFAEANPELTRTLVMVAAGMMALSIASRVAAFGFWSIMLPARQLAGFFLRFDEAGKNVATGWRILAGAGGILSGAFNLIATAAGAVLTGLGAISAPAWAIIAVLVAAGFALWKYWDRISSFVAGMADAIGSLLAPAIEGISSAIDGFITKIGEMLGLDQAQMEAFKASILEGLTAAFDVGAIIEGAKAQLDGFWSWLNGVFSQENLSDTDKAAMREAGSKMINDLWEGAKAKFAEFLEWCASIPGLIAAQIGQIDLTNMFKFDPGAFWAQVTGQGSPIAAPPVHSDPRFADLPVPATPGSMSHLKGALGVPDGNGLPALEGGALPTEVQQTINAEVIDKRPPQQFITVNAPVTVNEAGDGVAAGQATGNNIANSLQGALHDGVD